MLSYVSYIFFVALKVTLYAILAAAVFAVALALIPVEFRFRMQNTDEAADTLLFRASWLFSGLVFAVTADISGAYEYRLTVLGRNLIKKRDIFYDDEEDL